MNVSQRYLIHGVMPSLSAACCFAIMAACIKLASTDLPATQLVFLRSVIGLIIIFPIVSAKGIHFIKTSILPMHMLRGMVSLCAMICFFYAIAHIGLSEATLLNATSPFFISLLAMPVLKEKTSLKNAIALLVGFIGIVFVLKPGTNMFNIAALVGLCAGFFIASAKILIRYMAVTEPVLRTVFYYSIFSTLYSGVLMLWLWETPDVFTLILIAAGGVFATIGQISLTYSYSHNQAATVAPFTYITVILATLIAWLGWDEWPDFGSSMGIVLVMTACLSLILNSKQYQPADY